GHRPRTMGLHRKNHRDLMLAPVPAEIDRNLDVGEDAVDHPAGRPASVIYRSVGGRTTGVRAADGSASVLAVRVQRRPWRARWALAARRPRARIARPVS